MADSASGLERSFDHAAYSPIPTGPTGAADFVRSQQPIDGLESDLASLIRLGNVKQDAGEFAEATECFRRALDVAERTLAPENPDLIILLNDLTRLYLKQSAYQAAEPLLLRLLELKRSKGEDHPEVATVLASLAAVRRALGMHESAEQLWRRVVEIRQRTLAPNHFATASALEHLGEACAARGKIREALSAFQRALAIREKTLGNEHPSLRIARERIADLELQASDDLLDPTAADGTASTPERYLLLSGGPPTAKSAAPQPPVPAPLRLSSQQLPKVTAPAEPRPTREKKPSLILPLGYTPPAAPAEESVAESNQTQTVVMPLTAVDPRSAGEDGTSALATATLAYREALESVRDELEGTAEQPSLTQRTGEWFASAFAFVGTRELVVATALVVIALLGVAVATGRHAFGESASAKEPPTVALSIPTVNSIAASPIPVAPTGAAASKTESSATRSTKPRVAEEHVAPKKVADKKVDPPARVTIPALSTAVLSKLDSVEAKAAAVGNKAPEQFNLQPATTTFSQRRATFDDEQSNAPQRARLIGELPTPKVPTQVLDVEGEVRVRFNVDSLGRPVLETFSVVSSPNPLLTAAVRKVIPGMRFEPARTAGPDSKAIGDVVQIGFQFARSR